MIRESADVDATRRTLWNGNATNCIRIVLVRYAREVIGLGLFRESKVL